MVFFINIYGRATDPPDKGNQIVGDNDIVHSRYENAHYDRSYLRTGTKCANMYATGV